jgi:hypothetical protein
MGVLEFLNTNCAIDLSANSALLSLNYHRTGHKVVKRTASLVKRTNEKSYTERDKGNKIAERLAQKYTPE